MYKLTVFRKIFSLKLGKIAVVPLVGTWIEIYMQTQTVYTLSSFPSWERGLKSGNYHLSEHAERSRSPRGNVD